MKSIIQVLIMLAIVAGLVWAGVRLFTPEDEWVCENGEWVQRGQPSEPRPETPCLADGEEEQTEMVMVYFGSSEEDPAGEECFVTYPVEREVAGDDLKRSAVSALLDGPDEGEQQAGYFSSIPEAAAIQSITVEGGRARVDFTRGLEEEVGGSCRVAQIRSQITNTLTQFEDVSEVLITVEGESEAVLQP